MNTSKRLNGIYIGGVLITSTILLFISVVFIVSSQGHTIIQFTDEMKPRAETAKVIAAHKYHGVLFSMYRDGKRYFIRDGKRCTLFTTTFLETWEKNNAKTNQSPQFPES